MPNPKGRQPALTRRQIAHAKFCDRMRGRIRVKVTGRHPPSTLRWRASMLATAARLGIHHRVLRRYVLGLEVAREDWLQGHRGAGYTEHSNRAWPIGWRP
jgi:hypothetical protein